MQIFTLTVIEHPLRGADSITTSTHRRLEQANASAREFILESGNDPDDADTLESSDERIVYEITDVFTFIIERNEI